MASNGASKKILSIVALIGIGIAGRLAPHVPNATPITAVTITARKYIGRTWAFVIPLLVMAVTDLLIGIYDWRVMVSVYVSIALIASMSSIVKKFTSGISVVLLAAASSVLFFLVTNFAVWAFSPLYAKNLAGLLYCYEMGLPFFRSMLLGDVAYMTLLLAVFELAFRSSSVEEFSRRRLVRKSRRRENFYTDPLEVI
jgi:hypothetical protein